MPPKQQPIPFVPDREYTREDIFRLIGLNPSHLRSGGGWWWGPYHHYGPDWYVFATVAPAGRARHNYGNRWEGDLLRWQARPGFNRHHRHIRSLMSEEGRVFLFTGTTNRGPFVFQGLAQKARSRNTAPVTIWWRVPATTAQGASDGGATRRHPQPKANEPGPAPRQAVTTEQVIRDTAVTAQVKQAHGYRCQVCG